MKNTGIVHCLIKGMKGLVSKVTVVVCLWGSEMQKIGIKQLGKGQNAIKKDYQPHLLCISPCSAEGQTFVMLT